jgi:anti-sigma factor RsiW
MKMSIDEMISLAIDGELTLEQQRQVDQRLADDPEFAARYAHAEAMRKLRQLAWQMDMPSDVEAQRHSAVVLAAMHEAGNAHTVKIIKLLRISAAAAVLVLTAVGGFMVGRAKPMAPASATSAPIVGYTVDITLNDGTRVSQTFTTFQQAEKFVRAYRLEQKLAPRQSAPKVQVASEGIF